MDCSTAEHQFAIGFLQSARLAPYSPWLRGILGLFAPRLTIEA